MALLKAPQTSTSRALWNSVPLEHRDSIRVLSLADDADLSQGQIRCSFSAIRIANIKRQQTNSEGYCALSYTWGDADASHVIEINGFPVAIRPSLYEALPHVWARDPAARLWVDAVCIDQENDVEKMNQVSQMNHIYASADTVHVWLGPEAPSTATAWKFLGLVDQGGETSPVLTNGGADTRPVQPSAEWQRLVEMSRIGLLDDYEVVELPGKLLKFAECVESVKELLHRAWWKRLWTYQELLLAVQCTVNCGTFQMPWRNFCIAVEEIERIRPRPEFWPDGWARGIENVRSLTRSLNFRQSRAGMMKRMPPILTRLLLASNERKATDPRDRIFGLLGLIDNRHYPSLKPDYTETVKQVYTKTTHACIIASQTLEILHCAGLAYRTAETTNIPGGQDSPQTLQIAKDRAIEARLPSWVPNFNSDVCISKLSASFLDLDDASWSAGVVPEKADVKIVKSGSEFELTLSGCVLGYFVDSQLDAEMLMHGIPSCIAPPGRKSPFLGGGQPIMTAAKLADNLGSHTQGNCDCAQGSRRESCLFSVSWGELPPRTKPGDWLCRLDSGNLSSPYVVRPTQIRSEMEFLLIGHAPHMRQKLKVSSDQRHVWSFMDQTRRFNSIKTHVTLY